MWVELGEDLNGRGHGCASPGGPGWQVVGALALGSLPLFFKFLCL